MRGLKVSTGLSLPLWTLVFVCVAPLVSFGRLPVPGAALSQRLYNNVPPPPSPPRISRVHPGKGSPAVGSPVEVFERLILGELGLRLVNVDGRYLPPWRPASSFSARTCPPCRRSSSCGKAKLAGMPPPFVHLDSAAKRGPLLRGDDHVPLFLERTPTGNRLTELEIPF